MKRLRFFLLSLGLLLGFACFTSGAPVGGAEVPLSLAKKIALDFAAEQLPNATIAEAKLYRDLNDDAAVWVFELRAPGADTPLTVVTAAHRELPPVVMYWRGQPWHRDEAFLSTVRESLSDYKRQGAKADLADLRWEGPLAIWVPRHDTAGETTFTSVRERAEVSTRDVRALAAAKAQARSIKSSSDLATDTYIERLWLEVDGSNRGVVRSRAGTGEDLEPSPGHGDVGATPAYGAQRYISRVPYLFQGSTPDCGIVSMMDILLYYDANGFPALVDETNLDGLRQRLRTLMQWTTAGTYPDYQMAGANSYVSERGVAGFTFFYAARGNYRGSTSQNMSFTDLTSEIDAGRPAQINLRNYVKTNLTDEDYQNHAVCAVGYYTGAAAGASSRQWAIIHDNWKGSFSNPFQDVSEPYVDFSQVSDVIKIVPPARPTIAASAVSIDAPTNNTTVPLGATVAFTARAVVPVGLTVTRVELRVGSTLLRTATTPDAAQPTGITGALFSTTWTPTVGGSYTLTATLIDSLGRSTVASSSVSVPVIVSPPTVSWSAPQFDAAQFLANNATELSVVAASAGGNVASVDFILQGSTSVTLGRITPTAGATFTTLRNVTFTTPGSYTLRAIVTDTRGTSAYADRRITVLSGAASNNDAFAAATDLPAAGDVINTTSGRATKETGEPSHAGDAGGRSLWWRWTPTVSGTAVITTRGSSFDTLLAVYTGTALSNLRSVAFSDDDDYTFTSVVRFAVTAGTTYSIAVDGYEGDSGLVALTVLHSASASTNDNFAARATLSGSSATAVGSNIIATGETGEPHHDNAVGGRSLWWTWVAPASGSLSLSTIGSTFDTVLGVYTGSSLTSLVKVASDDDSGTDFTSSLTTLVVAGTAYQIAVDGFDATGFGRVRLALSFLAAGGRPTNDAFASRAPLVGNTVSIISDSAGATKETGEPNHAGSLGGASLWWTWTAPSDGSVSISTEGSTFDTVLAVYTGSALSGLSVVASDDDGGDNATSKLTFSARAGTVYQIAVDGYNRAAGPVALYLVFAPGGSVATTGGRLINVATRGLAGSGSSTMIAGFAITGPSAKPVLVRGIGPALRGFGISNALTDPVLSIYRGETRISVNDNWEENSNRAQVVEKSALIGAFALTAGTKDAVLLTTLAPGNYTAQVSAASGTSATGVTLVEVYDVDFNADADATGRRLVNLSTRGQVGVGGDILIAGLVVLGPDSKRVLIRGIGPALAAFNVPGALADPQLTLLRSNGTTVATNDNWSTPTAGSASAAEVAAGAAQSGAFALVSGSKDASLLLTLPPGGYTIQLGGAGGTTGIGLIEAYELP